MAFVTYDTTFKERGMHIVEQVRDTQSEADAAVEGDSCLVAYQGAVKDNVKAGYFIDIRDGLVYPNLEVVC